MANQVPKGRRITIVTDAWFPQVNGVVRTLAAIEHQLRDQGHVVKLITSVGRRTLPMPGYPEIRLSLVKAKTMAREIGGTLPDAIHIATEGPLGWAARKACHNLGLSYTTSFHSRFAEYVGARVPLPRVEAAVWQCLRRFHGRSHSVLAPTQSVCRLLEGKGFRNVVCWTRGVDRLVFRPHPAAHINLPRPILAYAGRLAAEKGIHAFMKLSVPGTKLLIGDGPERAKLQRAYPDAVFLGYKFGEDYAQHLAAADVLVFPSRTDTFGLVMIEAMACGTPVAAFNVASPNDVVEEGVTGCLDSDLDRAVTRALALDRKRVVEGSARFSWERATRQFTDTLVEAATGLTMARSTDGHSGSTLHRFNAAMPLPRGI